jgi:ABC-type transport system substrate-binding protein
MKGGGDAGTAAKAVQAGDADYAWNLQVTPDILKQITDAGKGLNLTPGGGVERILLNFSDPNTEVNGEKSSPQSKNPFFQDPLVRQAISYLVDRESIAKNLYGPAGNATCNILPSVPPQTNSKNTTCSFDVAKANALLDQAGWVKGSGGIRERNGKKLAFTHLDWAAQAQGKLIMEAIVPMLKDVGIDMTVKSLESAAFFPAYPKAESFGYEWLWSAPVDVLVIFNVIPTTAANGNLPDLKAAFDQWQTAKNNRQLKAAAYKAQLIWAQKLPKIPILTRNDIWVYNKKVHGWRPTQTMLYPLYNDVWVEH